jgi:plastocyanin
LRIAGAEVDFMKHRGKALLALGLGLVLMTWSACDDDDTDPSGIPTDATITITPSGVTPANVTVTVGGRVTFVNNDTAPHQPSSDPHPVHTDCPGVNQGVLQPGQSGTTLALTAVRTCGFHDHINDNTNASMRGTITVTN